MTSRIAVFVLHNRASGWDCKRREQIIRIVESDLFAIDCNRNCIDDLLEITDDTSLDINGNEIPDECECLADFTYNGSVNASDLLILLGEWGTPGSLLISTQMTSLISKIYSFSSLIGAIATKKLTHGSLLFATNRVLNSNRLIVGRNGSLNEIR